ncbi:MAG: hypothetical protein CUN56_00385 [Phototrophicales bacterium]|nr:MAG: hypothetical protein CUN56_00385 [Phototrophicales bacterium]
MTHTSLPIIRVDVQKAVDENGQTYSIFTGFCRYELGDVEVFALIDGYTDLGLDTFVGDDPVALQYFLGAAFVADDHIQFGVIAHAIRTPEATILIDAGSGTTFGPAAGHLFKSMALAGLEPNAFDLVLLSHLHTDHTGGLLVDERAAFPNAELVMNRIEYEFFTDAAAAAQSSARIKPAFTLAQRLGDFYPRIRLIEGEVWITSAVQALPAYGHTPGHTVFMVHSPKERLLVLGDTVFSSDFSFQYLDYTLAFDNDVTHARKTRRRLLTYAMQERLLIAGTHLPFTSLGHVRSYGPAFEFVPLRLVP